MAVPDERHSKETLVCHLNHLLEELVGRQREILSLLEGGSLVPDGCVAPPAPGPAVPLTARELDVTRELVKGRSNRQIARRLGISECTVKAHLQVVFFKLRAASRTEAAMNAVRQGLV